MSGMVVFADDRSWIASNWIVRGLVDDAMPHLDELPLLREEFVDCSRSGLLHLDFTSLGASAGVAMTDLLARVVRARGEDGPQAFAEPEFFGVYLKKLHQLAALAAEVARAPWSAPTWPWTAAGGRFAFEHLVEGEPIHGLFTGTQVLGGEGEVLVAVTSLQTVPYPELGKMLALPIAGVAPLAYVGPVDGDDGRDCVVERVPAGGSVLGLAPLSDVDTASLGADLARTLATAHEQGARLELWHPALVYAERRAGRLRLAAVAPRSLIVHATASPVCVGMRTVDAWYGSAELARSSGPTSPASDVASLCATLFRLGSGVHPFGAGSLIDQLSRCLTGTLEPWRGAPALGELLRRGMSPDPDARPSAHDLADALAASS